MVAVPGRSKGCKTCRRRKKGCDKVEPACGQCRAAGLVCGGYGRDLIWVHASAPEPAKIADADAREASISSHIVPWRDHYAAFDGEGVNIVLHDSLAQSARQIKYLGTFWSVYLPDGKEFSAVAGQRTTCGWTNILSQLYDTEPTLRIAALAISTSVMGGESNDQQLKIKGMQAYSRALQEMSVAIKDSKRWLGDGLLAAVRIMELYEVIFGADTQKYQQANVHVAGWRGHNAGQLAIILARGPESFRTGPGHKLFADARLQVLLGAMTKRKKSPLCQQKWRTIPWETQEKSYSDEIIDLLLSMGGLLEQLDDIRACRLPDEVAALREKLLQECLKAHHELQAWRAEMGNELELYDIDVAEGALPIPRNDKDLAQLHLTNVYWCVCILLYSTAEFLLPMVAGSTASSQAGDSTTTDTHGQTPDDSGWPAAGGETGTPTSTGFGGTSASPAEVASREAFLGHRPRTYARKVAHSVHLFWEAGIGAFGNQISLFPLGLALRYYMASEDLEKCDEFWLMCKLFYRPFLGTFVGRFLVDLQKDDGEDSKGPPQAGILVAQERAREWFYGKEQQS